MKIAYLVLAHNTPRVLKGAIATLSSEDCEFFIHIDQKSSMAEFSEIRGENVHFIEERLPIYWAEFSGVQATLLMIRKALESPQNPDYCVLMSGSDYPLRSGRYVHTFLEKHRGVEFMTIVKVPAPGKPLSRINTLRYPSHKPVRRFATRVLAKFGLAQRDYRKHLGSLEAYAGNTWWALTRDACQYLLEFVERNGHVVEYFQNAFVPDEAFFHTILGNSAFRSRIRRNLLYEDWSTQGAHPAMVNGQHISFFEGQDKVHGNGLDDEELLFARKFSDDSLELLHRIDDMIERKERSLCGNEPFESQ